MNLLVRWIMRDFKWVSIDFGRSVLWWIVCLRVTDLLLNRLSFDILPDILPTSADFFMPRLLLVSRLLLAMMRRMCRMCGRMWSSLFSGILSIAMSRIMAVLFSHMLHMLFLSLLLILFLSLPILLSFLLFDSLLFTLLLWVLFPIFPFINNFLICLLR